MGKTIVISSNKYNSEDDYDMRVVVSNHPQFGVGTRFDFGYHRIAVNQGYTIVYIPNDLSKGV